MEILTTIPHAFRRRFLPPLIDFSSWEKIEPFFQKLEGRSLETAEGLETWIRDRSELMDVVNEEGSLRYIRMTCDTENLDLKKAYFQFLEEISEKVKAADNRLKRLYLASPARPLLAREKYFIIDRSSQNDVDLFREENVPLETEESKLSQSYQQLMGSLTVQFEGKEQTLQQMGRYQEMPDRLLREAAWKAVVAQRLVESEKLEQIFNDLLFVRQKISANAGFASYRDYAFRRLERFDYTVDHCLRFHDGVEAAVVPVVRRIEQRRAKDLGLARLRPWDMNVDPLNRAPLKPFTEARELVDGCLRITERVDSRFGGFIQTMRDLELLNLESRKGKAPGGYQSSLAEARLPFVFMNAVGLDGDVRTLLHEAGHAFHVFATQEEPIGHYRQAPIEFCEVASMSMELLGGEYLSVFYPNPEDLDRSRKKHLEAVIDILPWIARVDAFQHWVYTRPNHTVDERRAYWVELHQRFGGIEDWSDFEHAQATSWHRQLHIFELPFYYIEYAIAQLGALQVWINSKKDFRAAVADYWSALQLGGSRPLPELFARAKVKFDFGPSALEPLMAAVEAELQKL
ncbi:MAG TPA: M3 family oligoendopeptidase [Terriglobia bacterium]|nr:M3 family oligoendopeptidase [Terriglobia bacterium]